MPVRPNDDDVDPPRDAWFHGTKAPIKQGETVLPRREHGGAPTNAPLTPGGERFQATDDYVYVTMRYGLACAYAHMSGGSGDPVVLLVEPQGTIEPDPESYDHLYAYRCESARVLAVGEVPISAEVPEASWKEPAETLTAFVVKNVKRPKA